MNLELLYVNNIKERIFPELSEKDFLSFIEKITNLYSSKSNHLWYDLKYLNSCLELFFIYYNKLSKPLPVFYALVLSGLKNPSQVFLDFNLSKNTYREVNFYLTTTSEYFINDLKITENDYDLYSSIKTYCDYIPVHIDNNSQLYGGLSIETDRGLSFKFKGKIDKTNLISYVARIVDTMTQRYEAIYNKDIQNLYLNKINYIVSESKNFKVR